MKPVVVALEKTNRVTAREAETPHEHWFQATFGTALSAAIDELKTVCLSTILRLY